MDPILLAYAAYAFVSIFMTVWVARTLSRNGRIFLVDAMNGNEPLADSTNHLLVVGFYLINFAFIALTLESYSDPDSGREVVELLSTKLGTILLIIGGMHFMNLYVLNRFRRRSREPFSRKAPRAAVTVNDGIASPNPT
ncbi:MAG: hypothetical protein R2832_15790 [Rhodothermales bacterium]